MTAMAFPLPGAHLAEAVQLVVAGIFGLLALATVVVAYLRRARPDKDWTELRQRVKTWWYVVVGFCLAVSFSRGIAITVLGLVSFLAFKEFLSLAPTRRSDQRPLIWAYLSIPLNFYWVYIGWYGMFIIFVPLYMFLFLATRTVLVGDTKGFLRSVGTLHWGLMTTVFCLSHAAYLLVLADDSSLGYTGVGLLLFLLLTTELNDIAQYLWGKALGRHKVIPKVSPNKTWEGLVGGVLTTTAVAAAIGGLLTPLTLPQAALAGALIGLSGFLGDVTISALKRDVGVKDSGTLLPGHGGVLDRLDSLTFTAPLFFHYLRYLYY